MLKSDILFLLSYSFMRRYCDGERHQAKISMHPHILSHLDYKKWFVVCHQSVCMDVHLTSARLHGGILFILSHVSDYTWGLNL